MNGLKRRDDRDQPGPFETALMVLSALVVVVLFGTALYHAATAPHEPRLEVEVGPGEPAGDVVEYPVTVHNSGATGWRSVTVEVGCGQPPVEVTLDNLPAAGSESFIVACPPGPPPTATVQSRVPP